MIDKTVPGWETLLCLFLHGPTWDGDVPSKSERDECVKRGLVARGDGYQWLTADGMRLCLNLGFGDEKQRRESRRRHRLALFNEAAKNFHETYCPTCPDPVCELGRQLGLAANSNGGAPMSEAQQVIRETHSEIRALQNKLEGIFVGRTARIVSNYNGQPYGRSKPSLKDHEAEIEAIYCDPTRSAPCLKLQGHDLYLGLDEVEIL